MTGPKADSKAQEVSNDEAELERLQRLDSYDAGGTSSDKMRGLTVDDLKPAVQPKHMSEINLFTQAAHPAGAMHYDDFDKFGDNSRVVGSGPDRSSMQQSSPDAKIGPKNSLIKSNGRSLSGDKTQKNKSSDMSAGGESHIYAYNTQNEP